MSTLLWRWFWPWVCGVGVCLNIYETLGKMTSQCGFALCLQVIEGLFNSSYFSTGVFAGFMQTVKPEQVQFTSFANVTSWTRRYR